MADDAKAAEKRRLAKALKANLSRRKAAAQRLGRETQIGQKSEISAEPHKAGDNGGKD